MVIIFAFACQMTEPKILDWFRQVGVQISPANQAPVPRRKPVYQAGLSSSPLDDTATRVNVHHCHVVNNPLYSAYLTTPSKDRLSVITCCATGSLEPSGSMARP